MTPRKHRNKTNHRQLRSIPVLFPESNGPRLCNVCLLQSVFRVNLAGPQVFDLTLEQASLLGVILEPGFGIGAAVGKEHHVVLDVALVVVGVGNIAGKLVELFGADWAHVLEASDGRVLSGLLRVLAVASRGLES